MAEEFNVLEHELVPEHHLLSEKEAEKAMKDLKLTKDQLPKIRLTDPCIRALDAIKGPVEEGMVVKIVRRSPTSGVAVCYRLVVRG
ncbi:MAG TPA: DNA-directed RNA polymerase subunit H [Thermoplasmata archaeon]|jgi:DNA-directed RNA polymerase subunit H|nr:DNA-directed RNA polymerase subunit H [Thermoplasmata archaeon]